MHSIDKLTARRDHTLDDEEIIRRRILIMERRAKDAGGSFGAPGDTEVIGAEVVLTNARGSIRVPFVEQDGHVRFGASYADNGES